MGSITDAQHTGFLAAVGARDANAFIAQGTLVTFLGTDAIYGSRGNGAHLFPCCRVLWDRHRLLRREGCIARFVGGGGRRGWWRGGEGIVCWGRVLG